MGEYGWNIMLLFIVVIQLSTLIYIWKFESKVLLEKERKNLSYTLYQEATNLEAFFRSSTISQVKLASFKSFSKP